MIDIDREELITIEQAAAYIAGRFKGSRKPTVNTVHRWCVVGLRGVKLESVKVGGVRATTKEAIQRFFAGNAKPVKNQRRAKPATPAAPEPSLIQPTKTIAMAAPLELENDRKKFTQTIATTELS